MPPLAGSITLSLTEVATHNTAADCWVVIASKVYDVTRYISAHPGGSVILEGCGKEATTLFDTKGGLGTTHSSFAHSLLGSFYLGDLNQQLTAGELQNRTGTIANQTIPQGGEDDEEDGE
jgi:cytochrome b involved in lipid metabolism